MSTEYTPLQPRKPQQIALSFSGGGFRAAAYSLGCLSYLNTLKLGDAPFLSLVTFTSSASGGSVTNLTYHQRLLQGEGFAEYYRFMNEQVLNGTKLLDRVFEIIADAARWEGRPDKSRNLINAFAIAYDELLFSGGRFDALLGNTGREVCINTTEFDNGLLFRFQNVPRCGNHFLYFLKAKQAALGKLKLGDILAASSCFPVGFEPLMYPRDFTHEALQGAELEAAIHQNPVYQGTGGTGTPAAAGPVCFGLMDGGIDDNQGIASFMLAEERLQARNSFGYDLYLSCDVSSNYTTGFDFPEEQIRSLWLKPTLLQYGLAIAALFGLSVPGVVFRIALPLPHYLAAITGFLLLLIMVLVVRIVSLARREQRREATFPVIFFRHIRLFLNLRLSLLAVLLWSRAKSAGQLAAVVFLKKIRRSSYDRLFEKISEIRAPATGLPEEAGGITLLKHWRSFSLQNALYLLSPRNDVQRKTALRQEPWYRRNPDVLPDGAIVKAATLLEPSAALQEVAGRASQMDTTLWYDEYHSRDHRNAALIAAGQFTTCYNLLRYALRFDAQDTYWASLQQRLASDWNAFNKNPYWKYEADGA